MKRSMVFVLVSALILSILLAGCGASTPSSANAPAEGGVKTGLGTVISTAKSTNAKADADALTEADVTMAAVTLGADGKILNVKIDMTQSQVKFNAQGQLTSDPAAEIKTKVELGNGYGMKKASKIGKEWYEQIAALEDWMTGKTIDQVMAMKTTAEGYSGEADLTSSVTIHVADYLKAVQKAVASAKDFGVKVSGKTKTGLGNTVSIAKSAAAAADKDALAETDDVMAAVTVDESGKIVGVVIDTAQVMINVDAKGQIKTDLNAELKTKVELGEQYGMKKASKIGKEWYEQAATIGKWMIGKTIDQVTGMKTTSEGYTSEADLTSSVTIHVADYIKAVQKAVANAD